MDVSFILDSLNDAQRAAVTAPLGPTLVLAGAGSGKTRVLMHRVAWLIQVEGASPHSMLAVTFTNKAAGEMRGRIETLLGIPAAALWIGTFHGLAHRLLRIHWREAGLPQTFQILDAEDQLRMVRKVLKALELDETRWVPREITWFINAQKDEGVRPKHVKDNGDPTRREFIRIYQAYEEACERAGVVDFAELLLRAFELWRDHPRSAGALPRALPPRAGGRVPGHQRDPVRVAEAARRRRRHAVRRRRRRSVDLSLARRARREPAAVPARLPGDQAVPPGTELSLDRHHSRGGQRAHRQQLRAARQEPVDQRRAGRADPALCRLQRARRGRLRRRIASASGRRRGGARREIAMLYRSNAQSRVFEEAFLSAASRTASTAACASSSAPRSRTRSPTCGSSRTATTTPRSSAWSICRRAASAPRRLESCASTRKANACSMWRAARRLPAARRLGPKARRGHAWLHAADRDTGRADSTASSCTSRSITCIQASGLIEHYQEGEGRARRGARREPARARERGARLRAGERHRAHAAQSLSRARGARSRARARPSAWEDCVQMMTLHSAKGLEFPVVFLVRHGRRPVPASALDQRPGRPRGGAPPLLRRHDARDARALS